MSPFRTIHASADLLGRERYVELGCFRALGERALHAGDASVMVVLSAAARSHAWRAKQLEELLPVSLGLPGADESTRSPGEAIDAAIALIATESDDAEVARALSRVLYPAMLASFREHLVSGEDAADRPASAVLGRVISDLEARLDDLSDVVDVGEGLLFGTSARLADLLEGALGPFGALG